MSKAGTKTGLFLIELIVALLLFAFCAAICMQLFVAARSRTRDSDNLCQSVYIATSAAECYKNSGGSLEAVQKLMGGEIIGDTLVIAYDINWVKVPGGLRVFTLTMRETGGGSTEVTVIENDIVTLDGEKGTLDTGDTIYSIAVKAVSNVA